jgi:DNA-binding transcriptional MerR regulator
MPDGAYTIGELCRQFGTTNRALRFYEEQGLLTPTRRDTARIYSQKDKARLQLILRGRRVGLTLAEIRDILDIYEEEGEAAQSAEALKIFRRRIEALQIERQEVDEAIARLQEAADRLTAKFPDAAAATGTRQ